MIKRIWHGWTTNENAAAYEDLLRHEIFHTIGKRHIKGFKGIELFKKKSTDEVEFLTIMSFESIDAVKEFAGADYETAVVPEKAQSLLTKYDAISSHYETVDTGTS